MMKFFRKYNKQLLAVFMVLLMVVFIGGSALESLLRTRPNRKVADSRYGEITLVHQQDARATTQLLEAIGVGWQRPLFAGQPPLETIDWILLRREAETLGFVPSATEVRIGAETAGLPDTIRQVAYVRGIKPDLIYSALAEFRSVSNAAYAIASSTRPSEADLRAAARDALEQVKVRAVLLPAQAFVDESAEVNEAELQEQFEKFRATEPGGGLNFGYYQYPRLKVQYVRIDRDAIMEQIGIANLESKGRAYYEKNKETDPLFRLEAGRTGSKQEAAAEGGAEPYLDWDAAKHLAENAIRRRHAMEAANQLASWLVQYAAEPWLDMERGEDGYRKVPPVAVDPSFYASAVERVPNSLRFPGAVTVAETDFFTRADASSMPQLGETAFRPERAAPRSFASLAFRSKPIIERIPADAGSGASDFLALFQTCEFPLKDAQGRFYYVFRIVDSQPGRPAESLDEVWEQVFADVRLARGFETARARAAQFTTGYDTIQDAYELDPDLTAFGEQEVAGISSGYFEPAPFSRVLRGDALNGRTSVGIWAGVGLGVLPAEIVAGCFALEHSESKLGVFAMPDRAAVLLVEWVETIRADEDGFRELRDSLQTQLAGARFRDTVAQWLTPENIQARAGLELVEN